MQGQGRCRNFPENDPKWACLSIRDTMRYIQQGRSTVIWKGLVCALILTRLAPAASTWPPQLEMRVPFEPTAFPSDGRTYLTYELYLTNFAANPITLRRVEVLDADDSGEVPVAAIEAGQLDGLLQSIGAQTTTDGNNDPHQLAGGRSVVLFLWITLEHGVHVPNRLL